MADAQAGRVRGPYRNGIKRRQDIIASAAKVFGEYGYAGGSLRQVAKRVGVTPAALTRHFPDKESLLVAVLQYWDSENDRLMPRDLHGIARVKQMPESARHHTHDRGLVEMFLTISAEASNPVHPLHDFVQRRYDRVLSAMIVELTWARDAGEVLPTLTDEHIVRDVKAAYALMDGIQLQWLLNPDWDLVSAFRAALGHFIEVWTGAPVTWDDAKVVEF
ncbi:TetR/AcrR family transcriptional regulator [Gryllotalpicola reticulitermitis]|uniref:TetR/AcrR family transcriptional regulator n=1 Tax=Gryllotalpicola reticulitermitis TaxID=1184153 RepID=A0ABV8Q672_9MICO